MVTDRRGYSEAKAVDAQSRLTAPSFEFGRYSRYKQASEKFLSWLRSAGQWTGGVSKIVECARRAVSTCKEIPGGVLSCLHTAIDLRRQALAFYKDANLSHEGQGHAFFVSVLRQAARVCSPSQHADKEDARPTTGAVAEPETTLNRFEALSVDDSTTEDTRSAEFDALETVSSVPGSCGQNSAVAREEDTEAADHYLEALYLLMDLHDLMNEVVSAWTDCAAGRLSLLAAAAVSNTCIAQADALANALQIKVPYLDHLDKVMTSVFFRSFIDGLCQKFPRSRSRRAVLEAIANLHGDMRRSPPREAWGNVMDHTEKLARALDSSEDEASGVILKFVTAVRKSDAADRGAHTRGSAVGLALEGWSKYLASPNDISHTCDMLCKMLPMYGRKHRLVAKTGFFGPEWSDSEPAGSTNELCADFLMAKVLPCWHIVFLIGGIQEVMPRQGQLMPLWRMFVRHERQGQVDLGLAFAVHAMLHATLVMSGRVRRTAVETMVAVELLNRSVEQVVEEIAQEGGLFSHDANLITNLRGVLGARLALVRHLANVQIPFTKEDREVGNTKEKVREMRNTGLWNPMLAGQNLAVAALPGALEMLETIDCLGQLRLVLHTYVALREAGVLTESLGLLELLARKLEAYPQLWVGGRPRRGEHLKSFMLSWGHSPQQASFCAQQLSADLLGVPVEGGRKQPNMRAAGVQCGRLRALNAEDVSEAWRRAFLMDFPELRGADSRQGEAVGAESEIQMLARLTREAVEGDELVGYNFPVIALALLHAVVAVVRAAGLEPLIEAAVEEQVRETVVGGRGGKGKKGSRKKTGKVGARQSPWVEGEGNTRWYGYVWQTQVVLAQCDKVVLQADEGQEPDQQLLGALEAAARALKASVPTLDTPNLRFLSRRAPPAPVAS